MTEPTVIILRGVAGAGKTTAVENWRIAQSGGHGYYSADHFWYDEKGNYNYDPKRAGEAHAWCFKRFLGGLDCDRTLLVDNTNISAWEINPYVLAATAYGYKHEIVTFWCDPAVAAARNVHRVPAHVVLAMHARLLREELLPFWNHRVVFDGRI